MHHPSSANVWVITAKNQDAYVYAAIWAAFKQAGKIKPDLFVCLHPISA